MPPLEPIQAIIGGGVATVLAVGLWWIGTGRGRVGSLVDTDKATAKAEAAERLKEVQRERDEWKALAQGTTPELKRLNDLLGTAVALLLDPARRPPP